MLTTDSFETILYLSYLEDSDGLSTITLNRLVAEYKTRQKDIRP